MKVWGWCGLAFWLILTFGCKGSGAANEFGAHHAKKTLDAATGVFKGLTTQSNGVPDGILNVTKCVVVFPAKSENGLVTCRETHDRWMAPSFVSLVRSQAQNSRREEGDLLIFAIGDAAVRSIRSGQMAVSNQSAAPGPTISQAVTVTDADLKRDLLIYRHSGDRIEGADARGVIRIIAPQSPAKASSLLEAVTSYFNSITPIGIIVHHSSTLPQAQLPGDVKDVDRFHANRGFDILCGGKQYHVAYHYLILPSGKIEAGRPERCEGAHSAGYNSYLGISVVGDFSSRDNPRGERGINSPTKQQLASLVKLSRELMGRYHIPLHRVVRHSDVARTECPGDRFPFRSFLSELR